MCGRCSTRAYRAIARGRSLARMMRRITQHIDGGQLVPADVIPR
jgi:hypothetical protein